MSEATQPKPQPPPEERAKALPFNEAALAKFRATAAEVLASHPEVRSAVVVLDFRGGLNDAKIDKAIWLGEDGGVTEPAAIFGSIYNMLGTLEVMFTRAAQTEQAMVQRAQLLGAEILKREQRLAELTQADKAAETTTAGPAVDGTDGPGGDWPDRIWYTGVRHEVREDPSNRKCLDNNIGEHTLRKLGYNREGHPSEVDGWWVKDRPKQPRENGRFTSPETVEGGPPARHRRLLDAEPKTDEGAADAILKDIDDHGKTGRENWPAEVHLEGDELWTNDTTNNRRCICAGVTPEELQARGYKRRGPFPTFWVRDAPAAPRPAGDQEVGRGNRG